MYSAATEVLGLENLLRSILTDIDGSNPTHGTETKRGGPPRLVPIDSRTTFDFSSGLIFSKHSTSAAMRKLQPLVDCCSHCPDCKREIEAEVEARLQQAPPPPPPKKKTTKVGRERIVKLLAEQREKDRRAKEEEEERKRANSKRKAVQRQQCPPKPAINDTQHPDNCHPPASHPPPILRCCLPECSRSRRWIAANDTRPMARCSEGCYSAFHRSCWRVLLRRSGIEENQEDPWLCPTPSCNGHVLRYDVVKPVDDRLGEPSVEPIYDPAVPFKITRTVVLGKSNATKKEATHRTPPVSVKPRAINTPQAREEPHAQESTPITRADHELLSSSPPPPLSTLGTEHHRPSIPIDSPAWVPLKRQNEEENDSSASASKQRRRRRPGNHKPKRQNERVRNQLALLRACGLLSDNEDDDDDVKTPPESAEPKMDAPAWREEDDIWALPEEIATTPLPPTLLSC